MGVVLYFNITVRFFKIESDIKYEYNFELAWYSMIHEIYQGNDR